METRFSPDRGLQARMAVMVLLVVVANVIFVTLLFEIALFVAEAGIWLLRISSQSPAYDPNQLVPTNISKFIAYGYTLLTMLLTNNSQWPAFEYNRLAVLPVTALFMLGQYWYVRRVTLPPSSMTDTLTMTDVEARITRWYCIGTRLTRPVLLNTTLSNSSVLIHTKPTECIESVA